MPVMQHQHVRGLPRWEQIRFAIDDMRARRLPTLFTIGTNMIAVAYVLVLGFFAFTIYKHYAAGSRLEMLGRVQAVVPDVNSAEAMLDDARLDEIRSLPEVLAVARVLEFPVKLFVNADNQAHVPLKTTEPEDVQFTPDKLIWGGQVSSEDAAEIIVNRGLFKDLGGSLNAGGPEPRDMTVQITRTENGAEVPLTLAVRLVGLCEDARADQAFAPRLFVEKMDRWSAHVLRSVETTSELAASQETYPAVHVYAPVEHLARVPEEGAMLRLEFEELGRFKALGLGVSGPVWTQLSGPAEGLAAMGREDRYKRWQLHEERVATLGNYTICTLKNGDPRWQYASDKQPAPFGAVLSLGAAHGANLTYCNVQVPIVQPASPVPLHADFACSPETLRFLQSAESLWANSPVETLLVTRSKETAIAIQREHPSARTLGKCSAWCLITRAPASPVLENTRTHGAASLTGPAAESMAAGATATVGSVVSEAGVRNAARAALVYSGYSTFGRKGELSGSQCAVRFVPEEFLETIAGTGLSRPAPAGEHAIPAVWTCPSWRSTTTSELNVAGLNVAIAHMITGDKDEFWLPESCRCDAEGIFRPNSIVCWGAWMDVLRTKGTILGSNAKLRVQTEAFPREFTFLIPGKITMSNDRDPLGVRVIYLKAFDANGRKLVALDAPGTQPMDDVLQRSLDADSKYGEVVGRTEFLKALWDVSKGAGAAPSGETRYALQARDAYALVQARNELTRLELTDEPYVPIHETEVVLFSVRDLDNANGRIGRDKVMGLEAMRPTFAHVQVLDDAEVELDEESYTLHASSPLDIRRFRDVVEHGTWLTEDGGMQQIVLPASQAEKLFPGKKPENCVGKEVLFEIALDESIQAATRTLELPMMVVGICPGDDFLTGSNLVSQIRGWQKGDLAFNQSARRFEEIEKSYNPYTTIKVDARNADAVPALVAQLEKMGFRTRHNLGEMAALRDLAIMLTFVVAFFTAGVLLNAAMTVFLVTTLNVQQKTPEIGLMRIQGMRTRDIVGIFVSQATIVSLIGFTAAAVAVAIADPALRKMVQITFKLPIDLQAEPSMVGAHNFWLLGIGLLIAWALSLVGVLFPALKAARMSPVAALRRGM